MGCYYHHVIQHVCDQGEGEGRGRGEREREREEGRGIGEGIVCRRVIARLKWRLVTSATCDLYKLDCRRDPRRNLLLCIAVAGEVQKTE